MNRVPFNILTGFLGSGKTTLLRRVLADEAAGETALLINEFGDVGIDHLLVEPIAPDTVLLPSGCVCCVVRDDLRTALLALDGRRQRGEIPPFKRVLLETTGLADPAPLRATLLRDVHVRGRFRLGLQATIVDAVNAGLQEELHPEWLSQVASADRLLISKTDMVDADSVAALQARLADLNPGAVVTQTDALSAGDLLLLGDALNDAATARAMEDEGWRLWQGRPLRRHGHAQVCCMKFDAPLDWTVFGVWLSMLLRCHGERILRVKGILRIADAPYPIAIHGVQHCLHPPVHLPAWPAGFEGSQLVFITRGLPVEQLERSLRAFLGAAG